MLRTILRSRVALFPGIRPGKATAEYIDFVLSRITFGGAIYLSAVCVLPTFFQQSYNVPPTVAMLFGGTSLMIIVGVALDMVRQIGVALDYSPIRWIR